MGSRRSHAARIVIHLSSLLNHVIWYNYFRLSHIVEKDMLQIGLMLTHRKTDPSVHYFSFLQEQRENDLRWCEYQVTVCTYLSPVMVRYSRNCRAEQTKSTKRYISMPLLPGTRRRCILDMLCIKVCNGLCNWLGALFGDEMPNLCNAQDLQVALPHPLIPDFLNVIPLAQVVRRVDGKDLPLLAHSSGD